MTVQDMFWLFFYGSSNFVKLSSNIHPSADLLSRLSLTQDVEEAEGMPMRMADAG